MPRVRFGVWGCATRAAQVFEFMMCSDDAVDAHRFMDMLDAAVKDGM